MSDYKEPHEAANRPQEEYRKRHDSTGHVWTGIFLLVIGGIALARSMGVPVPRWLFSWQMLLIAIGLFIGIKKGFRDGGWFVPVLIGGAFLLNEFVLEGQIRRHIWPIILIIIGFLFLIRARGRNWQVCREEKKDEMGNLGDGFFESDREYTEDDVVKSTCIFSGAKKVILSKHFKGGELVNIFGGCEIDLTQADMTSPAVVDVTAIFGGATLVVPSNWAIRSEAVTIFGGIGDKRKIMPSNESPARTLVIRGTMVFGGMEIKSY